MKKKKSPTGLLNISRKLMFKDAFAGRIQNPAELQLCRKISGDFSLSRRPENNSSKALLLDKMLRHLGSPFTEL